MNKIVIVADHGGFDLSKKACEWLKAHGLEVDHSGYLIDDECRQDPVYASPIFKGPNEYDGLLGNSDKPPIERHHPLLIQCVEELGEEANGRFAKFKIVEIPGNLYRILEWDGLEWVETPDSIDWIVIK